jgi:hypothetical protein
MKILHTTIILLLLSSLHLQAAQQKPRAAINAKIADICDAKTRCVNIVKERLSDKCGNDVTCLNVQVDRLDRIKQSRDDSAEDIANNIDDLLAQEEALEQRLDELEAEIAAKEDELESALDAAANNPGSNNTNAVSEMKNSLKDQSKAMEGAVTPTLKNENGFREYSPRVKEAEASAKEEKRKERREEKKRFLEYGTETVIPKNPIKTSRTATLNAVRNGWLVGFSMLERKDDPCRITIYSANKQFVTGPNRADQVDGDGSSKGQSDLFLVCDGDAEPGSEKLLAFNSTDYKITQNYPYAYRPAGVDMPYAINSIKVCQRRSNQLLKGAKIQAVGLSFEKDSVVTSQIMSDKTVVPSAAEAAKGAVPEIRKVFASAEFERPNCNDWQPTLMCPKGLVATGVIVHYDMNKKRAQIKDLSLKCATLVYQ